VPFAYIVECSDGTYYVGSTWNLERRLGEHNEGLGAEYTRRRRPVRLVWSVQLNRIDEAYRVEKQIQGWGRGKRLALIEGRFDDLPGLARTAKPRDPDAVVSTSSTDGGVVSTSSIDDEGVVSTGSTDEGVVSTSSTDDEGVVSTGSTDEGVVSTSSTDAEGPVSTGSTDDAGSTDEAGTTDDLVRRSRGR